MQSVKFDGRCVVKEQPDGDRSCTECRLLSAQALLRDAGWSNYECNDR